MDEFAYKQDCLQALLVEKKLDALLLTRVSSFAWATCGGASYVALTSGDGVASLLITPGGRYVLTNNIEAQRLQDEAHLAGQGWRIEAEPWFASGAALPRLANGLRLGSDSAIPGTVDLSVEMARLRSRLTAPEGERFRRLGRRCAEAMQALLPTIQPGQTERQIAARLSYEAELRGVQPVALMVAADERIFSYRHPLPSDRAMQQYVMVILCGRSDGLIASLTRCVYFGRLPDDLRRKMHAAAEIDAHMLAATRPGSSLGDVFAAAQQAYARAGWPDEWRLHHQGGSAGYEPREFVAVPGSPEPVIAGQAFAWNPSICGVKSEDTILVGDEQAELLTGMPDWPVLPVIVGDQVFERPAVWERD
ncbi:MAG: M24 family metallopeptidase [Chloroflexota bacterium]